MTNIEAFNSIDVVDDPSDGTQNLRQLLTTFNAHHSGQAASGIHKPYIYKAQSPVANADFGISDELVGEHSDGLIVVIQPYPNMQSGDTIKLYWADKVVAFKKVLPGQVGALITLNVPSDKIPQGHHSMFIDVGGKRSASVTTEVVYGQPGLGANGEVVELPAPNVAVPTTGVIEQAHAKSKVKVTIAPYSGMKAHDRIYLFWGEELATEHVVTSGQIGKPIVLEVDEAAIRRAGDSDRVPVYYYIEDEVGNESEWSADTWVNVNLSGKPTQPNHDQNPGAPIILDPNGAGASVSEVDLSGIADQDLEIKVPGPFQVGDSITLYWVGTTGEDFANALTLGPVVVTDAAQALTFKIPNDHLIKLGNGSGKAFYIRKRNNVEVVSKVAYVNFKGQIIRLPEPLVDEADEEAWVDADLANVHVIIPSTANLQHEDEVTVVWRGTQADGSVVELEGKMFRVSKSRAGKQLALRQVGKNFLKPFDGGWAEVAYRIKRGQVTVQSAWAFIDIGYTVETLAAPSTDPKLPENTLNPALDTYKFGLDVTIPDLGNLPTPCTVYLHWSTSEGFYYEDEQALEAGDKVSGFQVPKEELQIEGKEVVEVTLYYSVVWDDRPSQASRDLVFKIAAPGMPEPEMWIDQSTMVIENEPFPGSVYVGGKWTSGDLKVSPSYQLKVRLPKGGQPPFTFASSNRSVLTVDNQGKLTVLRKNGVSAITVTDARNQSTSYNVTVKGCFAFCTYIGVHRFDQLTNIRNFFIAQKTMGAPISQTMWARICQKYGPMPSVHIAGKWTSLGQRNSNNEVACCDGGTDAYQWAGNKQVFSAAMCAYIYP